MSELCRRLRMLFRRRRFERELEDEIAFHLDMKARENRDAGAGAEEARYAARRQFGNATLLREVSRDAWGWTALERLGQDLRYTLRLMRRNPGFTAVAVVTLALGIGASTAAFGFAYSMLLKPLPFRDPDRLAMVWESNPRRNLPYMFASPPTFLDWKAEPGAFESMSAFSLADRNLAGSIETERIRGALVSANLFTTLGAEPLAGRGFRAEDDREEAPRVVVIAHELWARRFRASPNALGQTLTLDGQAYTVVGVMPPEFSFPPPMVIEGMTPNLSAQFWAPIRLSAESSQRGAHYLYVIGRLQRGASRESAEAALGTVAQRLERDHPATNSGWTVRIVPLSEQVQAKIRPVLAVLLCAVAFVLLIACVNVANLLLARNASRQREMSVRLALGAGRARLIRQFLTESAALVLLGGLSGLVLSAWMLSVFARLGPANIPRLAEARVDLNVILFTFAISASTVFLCGLLPAIDASRAQIAADIRARRSGSRERNRALRTLVVCELALSVVLLAGAGLMLRSFLHLRTVPLGFQEASVLSASIRLPASAYAGGSDRVFFFNELHRRMVALPGVVAAGFINMIPLGADRQGTSFLVEGQPAYERTHANFSLVAHEYFRAMRIPILQGRAFTRDDTDRTTPVVIINGTLARRLFGDESALGKRLILDSPRRIVGVVADERHDTLQADFSPNLYLPYAQIPGTRELTLVLRADHSPAALATAIRTELRHLDAGLALYDVRTMAEVVSASMARPRLQMYVFLALAAAALGLAVTGVYGVVSHWVAERTHEIGVRMALGARTRGVLGMVLRQILSLTAVGIGIGLGGAFLLARSLSSLLFGVSAGDPLTFTTVGLLLAVAAVLACYIPARRATRIDPMEALRYE